MSETNIQSEPIHWGHFRAIFFVAILLLGFAWMKNPQLFSFLKKSQPVADAADVPQYVPYVPSADDQPQPAVLGASTDQGPQIIGDDGTVQSVDAGQVLAASTADVQLDPSSINVKQVPDSSEAIQKYFSQIQTIESQPIDTAAFESALTNQDQNLINQQADKLTGVRDALLKIEVPQSLVKMDQLTVIQYNAAIALLQNFNQADSNPDMVGQYLQEFMKSQQDLDNENSAVAQKLGGQDPYAFLYANSDATSAASTADNSNVDLTSGNENP